MHISVRQSIRAACVRPQICVAAGVMVLAALAPSPAVAQDNSQNISGTISVDFSNAYFFRGIKQEREGLVTQPASDLVWSLYDDPDAPGLHSVDFQIGIWNSLHTGPTGSGEGTSATHVRSWYEADFFSGFTLGIDNWEAGIVYTSYMSPNEAFSSVQEIAFSLGMDDEAFFGRFAMYPHVAMAVEMRGQADGGASEGVYMELGVEPGLKMVDDALGGRVSLTVPVTFGFSLSNYYENGADLKSRFGYFDIGVSAGFPLPMMPAGYGDWEISGAYHFLSLGEFLEAVNDGDGSQHIGSFGVSVGF